MGSVAINTMINIFFMILGFVICLRAKYSKKKASSQQKINLADEIIELEQKENNTPSSSFAS